MSVEDDDDTITAVFLANDAIPLLTYASPETIAMALRDAMAMADGDDAIVFARIPAHRGDALVRPRAIVAIIPVSEAEYSAAADDDD